MNLFLIRHGEAEDKRPKQRDSDRELTKEGIEKMINAVSSWKYFIGSIDLLISSPLVRAVQTAGIVKETLKLQKEIIKDNRLSPGSATEDIIELINEHPDENIALFGHEPDFSIHVSSLISSSGANINIKKGALAKISFSGKARLSRGILEYLIPPGIFKRSQEQL